MQSRRTKATAAYSAQPISDTQGVSADPTPCCAIANVQELSQTTWIRQSAMLNVMGLGAGLSRVYLTSVRLREFGTVIVSYGRAIAIPKARHAIDYMRCSIGHIDTSNTQKLGPSPRRQTKALA